jgi:cytochrome c5
MKPRYSIPFFAALCFCALPLRAQLPEGEGKEIIERECAACHDTGHISGQKKTRDDWIDTVSKMMDRGASLNAKEFDTVIAYLVKYFGKEDAKIGMSAPAVKRASH